MPDPPFASYRSQGYRLLRYHERILAGRPAQFGYLVGRGLPPLYAVRYRSRQAASDTFRAAVALLRARLGLPPPALR